MKDAVSTPQPDRGRYLRRLALTTLLALLPLTLVAQDPPQDPPQNPPNWADEVIAQEGYATPPRELADAVLAPRHLNVTLTNLSPDKAWFLDEIGDGPPPMARFATPYHELGGVFIDYGANRVHSLTARSNAGIQVISSTDGTRKELAIPDGARVSGARWNPDGTAVAYLAHTPDATHVWMTDIASDQPRQITQTALLATLVTSFDFTNDGAQIVVVQIPDGRSPMPMSSAVPAGPAIKVSVPDDNNRLRTYASLMTTPHQFELLEWHATGQLALVDVQTGAVTQVGAPAMIRSVDFAPNGQHARVTTMTKPFSYIVPVSSFGQVEEIWDLQGTVLTEISKRELNLGVQSDDDQGGGRGGRGGANQAGKRELRWRPDGQGLTYLEQEPAPEEEEDEPGVDAPAGRGGRGGRGGGAASEGEGQAGGRNGGRPDRVMQWLAPFSDDSTNQVYENRARMTGHRFNEDMSMLVYSESSGGNSVDYAVMLSDPTERFELMRSRTGDEGFYENPGSLMSAGGGGGGGGRGGRGGGGGGAVLVSADGSSVFYQGTRYDENPIETGPKTFIDKVAIRTGEKERIFESNNSGVWERVTSVLDIDLKRFILSSESRSLTPQQFLVADGIRTQLTNNEDIAPDLTAAPKQRFTVDRADGFNFRVEVTLPPGYEAGTRLPALFWFYPREYTDQEAYDQPNRTFNKNSFTSYGTRSVEYFTRLGYAVVEPDSPIIGEAGAMNNNYEHDLRNNLAAVIDELDRRQLVDRDRLAIGGHSYGAFSTVNAMVHTPFFKAGIAGDGNYNRTLTPLGFQSERRILWDAPQVYIGMSPFFQANNLTGALLMYHGIHDQNVGTAPDNSIRLFHALNGLGKTVSLYMYPLEDHGPATVETQLDLWARWAAWLDKYVKNPQIEEEAPATAGGGGGGGR